MRSRDSYPDPFVTDPGPMDRPPRPDWSIPRFYFDREAMRRKVEEMRQSGLIRGIAAHEPKKPGE